MNRASRWVCSLVVVLAGCAFARAEGQGQTRPAADAAAAFTALEDRLLKADTLRLDFHAAAEGAVEVDLRGSLHIGPEERILLTASGSFAGKPVDVALRAEGTELHIGSKTAPRPAHLKEALLIGLTRMGILHNLARLTSGREPDHATGGVREWVAVGAFGAPSAGTDALSFDITVAGQAAGSASLQMDARGRPVARRQIVKFPSGEMRVTERYSFDPQAPSRTPADRIAAIEGPQAAEGTQGLGKLTIDELMKRFNVPGVSIAVIHDFEIHWAKGYGIADVETGAPVSTETMFQAASISKPVAAMGVLRAVQDGLFTLDDDINGILTSWKLEGGEFTTDRPVTPRMLTSHTSGLGDGFGFPGYEPSAARPTVVQILAGHSSSNVGPLFMERPPMSLMEYSGGGVTLMQQALSDARKRSFADIMRDQVLRPIGMERSSFEQPISPEHDRNATRGHSREGKSKGAKWHVYPEQAAAGLWTTPSDLARFAIEVQKSAVGKSNRVLSRATMQEMLSPVGVGDYAVGFSIQKMGQGWYFQHGGSNWGFQATLLAHKVKGYGLAIMTNADSGGQVMGELSRRIQAAYEWDSLAQPAPRGYRPPDR